MRKSWREVAADYQRQAQSHYEAARILMHDPTHTDSMTRFYAEFYQINAATLSRMARNMARKGEQCRES